mgnify:CR=1 FL=1
MITAKQLADKLNITPCRVRVLTREGRITNCQKVGRDWVYSDSSQVIPAKHTNSTVKYGVKK